MYTNKSAGLEKDMLFLFSGIHTKTYPQKRESNRMVLRM